MNRRSFLSLFTLPYVGRFLPTSAPAQFSVPFTWHAVPQFPVPIDSSKVALVSRLIENALEEHERLLDEAMEQHLLSSK